MVRYSLIMFIICIIAVSAVAGQEELAHAIFVRVNGKVITQDNILQVSRYIIERDYKGQAPADEDELEKIQDAALRDLVRMNLIQHEAGQLGIKPNREATKRAIGQTGVKSEYITPTVRRVIESGEMFDDIMGREGTPIMPPSPREIKDFFNKNKEEFRTNAFVIIRSIFIPADTSQAQSYFKDRAESIQRELMAVPYPARTDAFASKAKEVSMDVFAQFGGLLTGPAENRWMPQEFNNRGKDGQDLFPQQMAQAIRNLTHKGEIALAVSKDGMHLVYLEDIRGGKIIPWDSASKMIDYMITQRIREDKMRVWLDRVFSRSDVKWHDGTKYDKTKLTEALLPSERSREKRM